MASKLTNWKREYYPIGASTLARSGASDLELVRHCIKKWEGLNAKPLRKHGLDVSEFNDKMIISKEDDGSVQRFAFNSSNCALCQRYQQARRCGKCPLAAVRNGTPCFESKGNEKKSPFYQDGPAKMIYWLRKAEERCVNEDRVATPSKLPDVKELRWQAAVELFQHLKTTAERNDYLIRYGSMVLEPSAIEIGDADIIVNIGGHRRVVWFDKGSLDVDLPHNMLRIDVLSMFGLVTVTDTQWSPPEFKKPQSVDVHL